MTTSSTWLKAIPQGGPLFRGQASALSDKAYDGTTATWRAWAGSQVPGLLGETGQQALNTREMQNLITTQALTGMKAIFGANPTEGERKALESMQGSADQPLELRNKVLDEAIRQARSRAEYEQQTVDELIGGTLYRPSASGGAQPVSGPRPRGDAAPEAAPPSSRIQQFRTQDEYAAAPSGTRFIAPDGKLRVKP